MDDNAATRLLEESVALERLGLVGAAINCARRALEQAQAAGDAGLAARVLVWLGDLHYRLGHFDEVQRLGDRALACAGEESHERIGALILLGNCAMEVGSLAQAEAYYQAAADLSRQTGNFFTLVSALHDLGACVYALRGQFELAFAAEEEAYRIACQVESPLKLAPLISMAYDCLLTGQYPRARQILAELDVHTRGNVRWHGHVDYLRALLAQLEGDLPAALHLYALSRQVAETTGDLGLNVFLRMGLSSCNQALGDFPAAFAWADDAVAWASRTGTRRLLGRALTERGRSAWLRGDPAAAESDLRLAAQDLRARGQAYDLARALLFLAALLHEQKHSEAEAVYLEVVTLIISGGFPSLLERERALAFPLIAHHLGQAGRAAQAVNATLLAGLAGVPPPPLEVHTLGGFAVKRRETVVPGSAWRRQAGELFRLLLISPGRRLARDQIMEAMWPEKLLQPAAAFFHQATSALRRALEPDLPEKFPSRYLLVEEGLVSLRLPPGTWVDFEVFEAHARAGEAEAALAVYRGEPFPEDRYQDWASWKREQLIRIYLDTLLSAATRRLQAGNAHQALDACRGILAEEPWHEQAALLGMRACLALNDRTGALRLYQELERCLDDEFQVRPIPELRQFYQSLVV